jgi:hypothetical protein
MTRPPTSSLLALLGAAIAASTALRTAWSTADATTAVGGALVLVLPYLLIALALARRSVWSTGFGVGSAGLMTWLSSFAVTEAVIGIQRGNQVRPVSLPFILLTVVGLAVFTLGFRDLSRAVHATGYWTRTPVDARLAFLAVCYWMAVFVADTYLTANPPLGRMLLAPSLLLIDLAAALMLRSPRPAAQLAGVVSAACACLAIVFFWMDYSSYLTLSGHPPAVPNVIYFTRLPWPLLLTASAVLNLVIVGLGARRLLSRAKPLPGTPGSERC